MPINLGSGAVSSIKLGTQDVSKIMLGTVEVYSDTPLPLRFDFRGTPALDVNFNLTAPTGTEVTVSYNGSDTIFTSVAGVINIVMSIGITTPFVITSAGVIEGIQQMNDSFTDVDIVLSLDLISLFRVADGDTEILWFDILDSSTVTDFQQAFRNTTALECLRRIDTTNATLTTDMFTGASNLINPTASEQTAILAGSNYINANACP